MIINGIVTAVLAFESAVDLKKKSIPVPRFVAYMAASLAANCIFRYQSFKSMLGGIIVGLIFLGFAIITREGVGYGDGVMFICIGTTVGLSENLRLLLYSLLLASFAGGIYAIIRKKNLKTKIPFIPFVFFSYIIMTIAEVVI